ncbi:MAG TPA: tetratricopeptide repeat protein [Chitinophagaceae bacterium]
MSILVLSCNTSTTKNNLSEVKNNVKAYPENVQHLSALLKQNPDSTGLRLLLATALDSIGAYKEALRQMDTLLKKDSANFGLWFAAGQIAQDAKDTTRAIMSYDKALRIYPSPDAMLGLAELYAEQKNERALLICKHVQELSLGREYDAHCAFIAGVYYARTGDRNKAIQFFDACIANNYTYMPAYIEKGIVYFDNRQYNEALKVFRFASTVNALDSDPYYWEGRCYEKMNIKDSAILRFKQSLHLEDAPETRAALKRLGAG